MVWFLMKYTIVGGFICIKRAVLYWILIRKNLTKNKYTNMKLSHNVICTTTFSDQCLLNAFKIPAESDHNILHWPKRVKIISTEEFIHLGQYLCIWSVFYCNPSFIANRSLSTVKMRSNFHKLVTISLLYDVFPKCIWSQFERLLIRFNESIHFLNWLRSRLKVWIIFSFPA